MLQEQSTPNHQISDQNKFELPKNWEIQEEYVNGNFKLVAEYKNTETGEKITITPYQDYDNLPGFCDSHKIEYWKDNQTWETIAKGKKKIKKPRKAILRAIEEMRKLENGD